MRLWTLNKLLVLVIIAAFTALLLEIRSAHQDILGEHAVGWTPVIYSALMIIAGILGLIFWQSWGRRLLFGAFAVGLIVGVLGFWQHNEEHFGQRLGYVFTVWGKATAAHHEHDEQNGESAGNHEHANSGGRESPAPLIPPVFAPLTFAGLGLIGMLACAGRFQTAQAAVDQR